MRFKKVCSASLADYLYRQRLCSKSTSLKSTSKTCAEDNVLHENGSLIGWWVSRVVFEPCRRSQVATHRRRLLEPSRNRSKQWQQYAHRRQACQLNSRTQHWKDCSGSLGRLQLLIQWLYGVMGKMKMMSSVWICSVLTWLGISESVPDWITESWLVTLERPSLCRYISTDYSCESSTLPNKTEMSWAHQIHWTASTPSGGVIHKGQDLTAQCNADVGCYLPHLWVWHNHNLTAIVKGMLAHSSTTGVLHLTVCLCFQIVTIYVQWHLLL